MPVYTPSFEAATVGSAPPLTTVAPALRSVSAAVVDSTRALSGTKSIKFSPVSGTAAQMQYGEGTTYSFGSTSGLAVRAHFYLTAAPTSDTPLLSIYSQNDQRAAALTLKPDGKIALRDYATNPLATSTASLASYINKWMCVDLYMSGVGTGKTATGAIYDEGSLTPAATVTSNAARTHASATALAWLVVGKTGATDYATPFWMSALTIDTAATGLLGPYATPLAAPTSVSAALVTAVTTIGGSDGVVDVSWSAVSGAGSYEVGLYASSASSYTAQATVTAPTVTCRFTGLPAGSLYPAVRALP